MRRQGEIRGQVYLHAEGQGVSGKDRFENVRGMRRQGEIRSQACSHPEGQGVSGKIAFICSFCEGKQGLEQMLSWGNHECPSNYKAKPLFSSKA